MAARAPAGVERLTVVLGPGELAGSAVSFLRADLERAGRHAGSPAEIWRTTELDPAATAGAAPGRGGGPRGRRRTRSGGGPLGPSHPPPAGAELERAQRLLRLPDDARLCDGERAFERHRQRYRLAVQYCGQP